MAGSDRDIDLHFGVTLSIFPALSFSAKEVVCGGACCAGVVVGRSDGFPDPARYTDCELAWETNRGDTVLN